MSYVSFNPLSPEHRNNPFQLFEELVRLGPLHRTRSGLLLVCGNALATRVLKDRHLRTDYSTALAKAYGPEFSTHASLRYLSDSFVLTGDKANGEVRRHFAKMLSHTRVHGYADEMRECAQSLLNRARTLPEMDLLHEFAAPYTQMTLAKLLSIPIDLLREIPTDLLAALDCAKLPRSKLRLLDERLAAAAEIFIPFLHSESALRSECVSGLLDIADKNALSLESVFADLVFIVVAGSETTSTAIAQLAWFLAAQPDIATQLAADPSSTSRAVEEFARLFPSIHIVTRRPASDVEVGGYCVRDTDTLLVLIAAANRDPSVFPEPTAFKLGRPEISRTLAFGTGIHYCVGAAAAREQIGIAIELLAAWEGLSSKAVSLHWRRLGVFRSLEATWFTDPSKRQSVRQLKLNG